MKSGEIKAYQSILHCNLNYVANAQKTPLLESDAQGSFAAGMEDCASSLV
jgi:hypothetical protein